MPCVSRKIAAQASAGGGGAWPMLVSLAVVASLGVSCTPHAERFALPPVASPLGPGAWQVRADQPWVETDLYVSAGQAITIVADGRIQVEDGAGRAVSVGPEGTYLFAAEEEGKPFPLPAAGAGPAPCYCLVGRVGRQGEPFYVGPFRSWRAPASGRLWLGINHYRFTDGEGCFYADVRFPDEVQPITRRWVLPTGGTPVPLERSRERRGDGVSPRLSSPRPRVSSVVIFYVDGLRPDVLEEMAAMGHVPTIRRHFIEGGTMLAHAFAPFPSDTITSNGTMWTGCFSDRHGLKGQTAFNRRGMASQNYLDNLGPVRSAQLLGPHGVDRVLHESQATVVGAFWGEEAEEQWRRTRTSETPAIYDYLARSGREFGTGVLPVMAETAPPLWTRYIAREIPYFAAHQARQYIDEANARYAIDQLLWRNLPVTIIWLPETDEVSHHQFRGQFGMARRAIAYADRLIGEVIDELRVQGRLDSTYLILISDHGHLGGRDAHLQRYDLANEFFYHPRLVTRDGRWVGGGLGLSVREHRYSNYHTGDGPRDFVFLDAQADGVARVFLPRAHYRSGEWLGRNQPGALMRYAVSPHRPPVDLFAALLEARSRTSDGRIEHPVDLLLAKLDENSVLVASRDRGWAIIDRIRGRGSGVGGQEGYLDSGETVASFQWPVVSDSEAHEPSFTWLYRYRVISDVRPRPDGGIDYRVVERPTYDPLGICEALGYRANGRYFDDRAWLAMTADTQYPDSIVALAAHVLWSRSLAPREEEEAPDLVVIARRGWLFHRRNEPGTAHGYPLAESMRATWYVSGPGIRRNTIVEEPCRLTDLLPTVLEMTGTPFDPSGMDGRPLRAIYESRETGDDARETLQGSGVAVQVSQSETAPPTSESRAASPVSCLVFWQDVDLGAWQPLPYNPRPEYAQQPITINRPNSPADLNNIAYNLMSISEWSVLGIVDDLTLARDRSRRARRFWSLDRATARVHNEVDEHTIASGHDWLSDALHALDLRSLAAGDYNMNSSGNWQRASNVVDWLQQRAADVDGAIAGPLGAPTVLGTPLVNPGVDLVQEGVLGVRRFGDRLVIEVLDKQVIDGLENGVDHVLNLTRATPAEIVID